ncbi:transporter substrate-binding domain-containing protein [Nonomuraea sp. NPDC049637]|uniref:caspase, EACC1-associated type n=1 Tax=Nonomuraea sp. NPDC049637 TaxID=3154356 RepID=UPI0034418385
MSRKPLLDGGGSRAVLIGAGTFHDPELPDIPAVRRNLEDLREVLTHPVHGLLTADHCQILADPADQAAVGVALTAAVREAEDLLLVYYCGHGVLDDTGVLHFALTGTDAEHVGFSAIHVDLVKRMVGSARAKARVLLLDCCFSGQAVTVMSNRRSLALGQLDLTGTYTLTSTPATALSHAPLGARNTAFTGALLNALRMPGPLTLDQIHRHIDQELVGRGLPRPQRRSVGTAGNLTVTRGPIKPPPPPAVAELSSRQGLRPATSRSHKKAPSATAKTGRALLAMLPLVLLPGSTYAPEAPDSFLDATRVVAGVWKDDGNRNNAADSSYNEDVIRGLLALAGFKRDITFKKVAREDAIRTLVSNGVHIAGTLGITASRESQVDFVGPLASARLGVLVRHQERGVEKTSDLSGRRVCTVAGSTTLEYLKNEMGVMITAQRSLGDCLTRLYQHAVDAIVGDRLTLAGIDLAEQQGTKFVNGIRFGPRESIGFAIPKGDHDTCERLRIALQKYVGSKDWREHFSERLPLKQDFLEAQPTLEQINEVSCRASAAD